MSMDSMQPKPSFWFENMAFLALFAQQSAKHQTMGHQRSTGSPANPLILVERICFSAVLLLFCCFSENDIKIFLHMLQAPRKQVFCHGPRKSSLFPLTFNVTTHEFCLDRPLCFPCSMLSSSSSGRQQLCHSWM